MKIEFSTPLLWPQGRKRSRHLGYIPKLKHRDESVDYIIQSQFRMNGERINWNEAERRLATALNSLGVSGSAVVSSNVDPAKLYNRPKDAGVAVYFKFKGDQLCFPCDRYDTAADNLVAIATHLAAIKTIERHGVASVKEMFTGFVALPQPKSWREVLEIPDVPGAITKTMIEKQYRVLAKKNHPDAGGSNTAMAELNSAKEKAYAELGFK